MKSLKIFEQTGSREYSVELGVANVKIYLNVDIGIEIYSTIRYKDTKYVINRRTEESNFSTDSRKILIENSKIFNTLIDLDVNKDYDELMYKELLRCSSERVYYEILDQILSPKTVMFNETKEKRDMLHDIKYIIKRFIFEINASKLKNKFIEGVKEINRKQDIDYFLGKTQTMYKVVPKDGNIFNKKPINLVLIRSSLPYEDAMNKVYKIYRSNIDKAFMSMSQKQLRQPLTRSIIPEIE